MRPAAEFDVIVYGASGYTGRLVAEYLNQCAAAGPSLNWAIAGRNHDKLAAVRAEIGVPSSVAIIEADGADPASLVAMAARAKVIVSTVGPYQLYGAELIAACAAANTDYVDLCGEPAWMRSMIDAHDATARTSGARIVFSCGFDSIPFDLGVAFLQSAAVAKFGKTCPRVKGRVRKMKGTFSGGTAASMKATMAAAVRDPGVIELLKSPFALTPGFAGPKQPAGMKPEIDPSLGVWVAPFVMAPINTKNVHRTNMLRGFPYGRDFVYDEMIVTGPGEKGEAVANAIAGDRSLAGANSLKPGDGPSKAEREAGSYDVLFVGEMADGQSIRASVAGDMDPGYGSTSKMITESALCLLRDVPTGAGGITTPGAYLGDKLIARLQAHAGLTFKLE